MIFMRPGDYHGIEISRQDSLTITNVAFRLETLHFLRKRYFPDSTRWFWSKNRAPTIFKLEQQMLIEMTQIADTLAREPRRAFYIERFLINLLYRLELPHRQPFPSHAPDWLLNACRKIEVTETLREGVQGFVKVSGRCHEHVARVMRACLGESPSDYVNRVRMRHAAQQLEMTDRPIIDIALDCGLENLSHFYKLFRIVHKTSPRRFRMARRRLL
jgi:AraC family cel operon transcriptional repressor